MKPTATSRFVTACLLLVSLLFTQIALASYVCPVTTSRTSTAGTTEPLRQISASPCQQQDMAQPSLCHAYASDAGSKLSLDKPDTPGVAVFLPVHMAQTIYLSDAHSASQSLVTNSRVIEPSSSPPATILHCCFRI